MAKAGREKDIVMASDAISPPDSLEDGADPSESAGWWKTIKTTPDLGADSKKPNRSHLTQEMENFKHVPVIGRLPWRWQYMLFSIFLLSSLLVVFYSANLILQHNQQTRENPQALIRQAVLQLDQDIESHLSGSETNSGSESINEVTRVLSFVPAQTETVNAWREIEPLLNNFFAQTELSQSMRASSESVYTALEAAAITANEPWRQAGETGQWENVDAVNFAMMLSDMQYLSERARAVQDGGPVPARFSVSRQNIEQGMRAFAASPQSTELTPLSQAWRAAAGGFVEARNHLDNIIGRASAWNSYVGTVEVYQSLRPQLLSIESQQSVLPSWVATALLTSGSCVIFSLFIILWISWKQQQWHVLEARANNEQLELSVFDMSQQLKDVATGVLTTRVKPSSPTLVALAEAVNAAVKSIHLVAKNVKETAAGTTQAANKATEATGALVDSTRDHLNNLFESGQDIIAISSAVQRVSLLSEEAEHFTKETLEAVEVGQEAVEDARNRIENIRSKSEEGASRSNRLKQSSSEILFVSTLLNEIAEQMSVLSIQAALQAAKAGEAGQGFRVVADGLKSLSEKSGESSRRVSSLIEATIADIQAMEEAMAEVTHETDEGSRLSDISMESTLAVSARIMQLKDLIDEMRSILVEQEKAATSLGERTEIGLQKIEESNKKAQDAAESVVDLVDSVRALGNSTVKLKV